MKCVNQHRVEVGEGEGVASFRTRDYHAPTEGLVILAGRAGNELGDGAQRRVGVKYWLIHCVGRRRCPPRRGTHIT